MKTLGIKNSGEILGAPNFVQDVVLSSGVAQAFDTPAGAAYVAFAFTDNIRAQYGTTGAALPTTTSTNSSGSELNPTIRNLGSTLSTTGISIISPSACNGSLAWFNKP